MNIYVTRKQGNKCHLPTYLGWLQTGFYSDKENVLSPEELAKQYPLGEKVTLWDFNPKGDNPDKKRVI